MSVVAVRVNKKNIEIASDSIIVRTGGTKRTDSTWHKLTKINDTIIGAVGNAEETSLFMNYAETHNIPESTESGILSYLCDFMKWKSDLVGEADIENEYVIVYNGRAFSVCHLFIEEITDFDAIGAGQDYALAALYLGHSPKEAVKVACNLSCFVSEPIIEYTVKK